MIMTKPLAPHDTRREIKIKYAHGRLIPIADIGTWMSLAGKGEFNMREVLPGEITINREELIGVFARAYCTPGNTHKILDSEIGLAMVAELFGPLPEGDK